MKCKYPLLYFITSGLLFLSCSSEIDQQNQLDYSTIPLTKLQKNFSITDSEDYILGRLFRLMVTHDGYILISDRAENSIHQFDSLGNYIERVASPGPGPGELSRNANPHFNGKILVMSNNDGKLSEYRQNEKGIFEFKEDHIIRPPGPMWGIRSSDDFSEFYVKVDSARVPFGTIPPEFTKDFIHLVKISDDTLQVEEKILTVKKHSSYVEIVDGGSAMRYSSLPYRFSDNFSPLPDEKLLVYRPEESAIQIYNEEMEVDHELILNIKDRPVTEEDMAFHFPDNSRAEQRERKSLIKEIKPPFMEGTFMGVRFMGVILDDQNRFWLHTDDTEDGKEYVILSYEGEPLGRVLIPSESTLHAIQGGKIYLMDPSQPSIDVYTVNL